MGFFGWIKPVQVVPTDLMVKVCWWLSAGMFLSAATAWCVLDVLAIRAFTEHSAIIVLMTILWLVTVFALNMLFERFKTRSALIGLAMLSISSGLLSASLFALSACVLLFGVIGGMFALSAAIIWLIGDALYGARAYWLIAFTGCGLAALANILHHSSILLWIGSLFLVLLFSLMSARKSKAILLSARELYSREFTTVQCCATRGALSIWLEAILIFFEIVELVSYLIPGSYGPTR